MGQNRDSIQTAALLPDSLMNVNVIDLESVSLSDMQSLKTVC